MRRVIILALLLGGMRLVLPLGTGSSSAHSLLTFGFLILAAYTSGEVAVSFRMPRIVGYLVAVLDSGLNVKSGRSIDGVRPIGRPADRTDRLWINGVPR